MHIEVPHGCARTHHGYQSLAECTWPDAAYVVGDGPYALVAHCQMLTVALYETLAEARRRIRRLDADRCAKTCVGDHELVALPAPRAHSTDHSHRARARLRPRYAGPPGECNRLAPLFDLTS